jgi:hypothetical protein
VGNTLKGQSDLSRLAEDVVPNLVESSDLIFLQVALATLIDDNSRRIDPGLYRRYLTMFLNRIRADRGLVLVGEPDHFHAALPEVGHDVVASS